MNPQRLTEIEARVTAATRGSWEAGIRCVWPTRAGSPEAIITDGDDGTGGVLYEEDAVFIAHARQDVPDLVAEVRRLRAQVRALEEHVARLMAADKPDPEGRGSR